MAFDPTTLLHLDIPETVQTYGPDECILYALGAGAGMDPLNEAQLAFVDENRLQALPSMATVLGYRGFWVEDLPTDINVQKVLHAEQRLRIESPLPPAARIRRKTRVTHVVDRGAERGLFVYTVDSIVDDGNGTLLATLGSTLLCRDEGNMGGAQERPFMPQPVPHRAPDSSVSIASSPQQALIYRLSGDRNPLHSDPTFARVAGFPAPILHGLATYGMACQALVLALCDGDAAAVRALDVRFTRPVFPGEALELQYWRLSSGIFAFRVHASKRDVVVIDNGRFETRT